MALLVIPLALPLIGLGLLLSEPELDVHWVARSAHFWLVLITALLSVVLGYLAGEAARRVGDARLFLVSLAFVTSAGFLALHALATLGVLLEKKNAVFVVATPVGLAIASIFAAASALDLSPSASAAVMRRQWLLRGIVSARGASTRCPTCHPSIHGPDRGGAPPAVRACCVGLPLRVRSGALRPALPPQAVRCPPTSPPPSRCSPRR